MRISQATTIGSLTAVIAGSVLVSAPAFAQQQEGYFFIPSLTVARVHDDNIFFSAEDEVDDEITRLTPALEAGFDSERFSWRGNYTFDAESYKDNDQLDSSNVRRLAERGVEYLPSQVLTLGIDTTYIKTETPEDLALVAGIPAGRFSAENLTIVPRAAYRFSAATTGRFEYSLSKDEISDLISNDTHIARSRIDRALSSANTFSYGYTYRKYEFSGSNGDDSHTPWIGWAHEFSESTSFEAELGPRIGNDYTDPYVMLSLRHEYSSGFAEIGLTVDETTSIGDLGIIENRTVSANLFHRFTDNFSVSLTSNIGEVEYYGLTSDVARYGIDFNYRIMDTLFLFATYNHNQQRAGFLELNGRDISRSAFAIGFTLTFPDRRSNEQQP